MKVLSSLLLATLLSLGLIGTYALADENKAEQTEKELHPTQEPGLDRDRAAYRAKHLEEKRVEEEARRKGAGLDRERARKRAEKLDEQREHKDD
jgi:hypothetical protein